MRNSAFKAQEEMMRAETKKFISDNNESARQFIQKFIQIMFVFTFVSNVARVIKGELPLCFMAFFPSFIFLMSFIVLKNYH